MADLGGIQYPIQTTYDGSGVQNFIADLSFARAAFRQFKDDLAASGKSGREFAAAERTIADGARLVQQSLTKQVAGLKAVTAAAKEAAAAQKSVANVAGTLPQTTAQTAKNTQAVSSNLKSATTQASLLNGTILKMLVFREVVRVIQLGVGAFKDFVEQGVAFNAELEKTQLGIAGLIASIATIKNAQGQTLEGAEKFAAAQAEARRQTQLLTQDALRTGFAVKQLSQNFETAVGPGLAAGLKLDEIRQLAVRVAQIAPAVSLQQNQLAQEIRSLTTGHIRSQTDRIATIFGITSEDITRAKAAGTLFEFLESKFKGFQAVAEELPNTFDGLINRVKTMVELTSALSSEGLFKELKDSLKDVRDTIFVQGAVNPKIIEILKVIFDSVTKVVRAARDMAKSFGLEGAQDAAKGVAAAIEVIGGALLGIARLVADVLSLFGKVQDALGLNVRGVADFAATLLTIVGTMKLLIPLFSTLAVTAGATSTAVAGWVSGLGKATLLLAGMVEGGLALHNAFSDQKATLSDITDHFSAMGRAIKSVFTGVGPATVEGQLLASFGSDLGPAFEKVGKNAAERFANGFKAGVVNPVKSAISDAFSNLPDSFQTAIKAGGAALLGSKAGGNTFEKDKRALNEAEKESIRLANEKSVTLQLEALHLSEITKLRSENAEKEKIAVLAAKQQTEELRLQRSNLEADTEAKIAKLEQTKGAEEDETAIQAQRTALRTEEAGQLAVIDQKIASSLEGERASRLALQDKVNLRLREAELLRQQTDLIQAQAALDEQTAKNKNSLLDSDEQRLAELRGELDILVKQRENIDHNFETQKQLIELQKQAKQISPQEALRQQAELQERHTQAVAKSNAEYVQTQQELEAIDKKLNGGFGQGAFEGLVAGAKALPTAFEGTFEIIKGAVNGLASTISQVLIDAFDPNNDTSAKDRFKEFLRGLLIQVVQFFTQLALAKAILGASGSGSGGLSGGIAGIVGQIIGTAAAAQGGVIRSPGHYRRDVGSFAAGGNVRPPNWVDRRDTVAAWLQPGEFVMPVSSVRQYGLAMMDSLRRGAIAPAAVHAAAGIGGAHVAASPPKGRSLAAGGAVAAGIGGVANDQPTPAFLVADDKAMERMLNGGKNAYMRFMRENADQVDGILRRSRPQTR